jgi:glycosyl-4,4'-diaponeurosporenoate acyltransferase
LARIDLPIAWVITLNILGWPIIQLVLAWVFIRMPATWFNPAGAHPPHRGERFYERILRIKRWKDRLPDAARWFGGGFAKGTLAADDPDYLRRFVRETRRGELCHWVALGFAPVFFLWNPWWADVIMLAYALVANLPCIFVQRYNRARLQRVFFRRTRKPPRDNASC